MHTTAPRTIPDLQTLRDAAVRVLRRNDLGSVTSAGPDLYPHQWSWDAAFVAIGLARVDVPRAIIELRSLLAAQWSTGMLPHALLLGEHWMGYPALRYALPPSTSPDSPDFRQRTYWRGPVWPFLNLLLGWAVARDQAWELHATLRDESLRQLGGLTFAWYYDPITGEPLGSQQQAWTAAAALEWLG